MNFNRAVFTGAGFLTLALVSSQALAAGTIQGKRFQDWGGNCEANPQLGQLCYLEQVLHDGNKKVMVSVIGYLPGQTTPTLMFELPPKIHLPAGFSISMGRQVLTRFKGKCTPKNCNAGFNLNPRIVAQFQKGRDATVSYTPSPNQPPIQLPLSLMGITAGLNALKQP